MTTILFNAMLCTCILERCAAAAHDWNPHRHSRLYTDFAETGQVQPTVGGEGTVMSDRPARAQKSMNKYEKNVCLCVCWGACSIGSIYCYLLLSRFRVPSIIYYIC